ncbi:hypothetical protein V8G54_032369 [Vigna mungo]|uniref:Uncharacterized protein n=1 Tax=Vigna mungo TaxID=3915 RepID=A0AAQ3RGL9_VIGMU
MRFKFMSFRSQQVHVSYTIQRSTSLKSFFKSKSCQGGIPTSRAPCNTKPLPIYFSIVNQVCSTTTTVIDINYSPTSQKPFTKLPAITSASTIININKSPTPTSPVLNAQI